MRIDAITGKQGAGKTSALLSVCRLFDERGLRVGGVLQLACLEGGLRLGYDLVCVGRGFVSVAEIERLKEEPKHPGRLPFVRPAAAGRGFSFDESLWSHAAEAIRAARREADLLVIDELGWIEAEGGGHMPALLESLESERCQRWMLSVRHDRCDEIERRVGPFQRTWTVPKDKGKWI